MDKPESGYIMTYEAQLVLESRGFTSTVNNTSVVDAWSRLYRSQNYFIDVSCHPKGEVLTLFGRLLLADGSHIYDESEVILTDEHQNEIDRAPLDEHGQFSLGLEVSGRYHLSVKLGQIRIDIKKIEAN